MSKFEIYSLILCLIVFVLLVGVFSYFLTIIVKQALRQIRGGLEDEEIIKEFNTVSEKKQGKFAKIFDGIVNGLLCVFFAAVFISSLYINCTQDVYMDNVPTYRVVLTSSMETKNEKNKYLFDNQLDNQIAAFDLIATYKLPKEEDLKIYDIIVYEMDGILVVHRIVNIEEPNASHPNERYFLVQGDAVGQPDRFPVLYSQMKGIYRNEKIPFVGSFVLFMQSPAGWLCMLLVAFTIICTPILEKKLLEARKARYLLLMQQAEIAPAEAPAETFTEIPAETPAQVPSETPMEIPTEVPAEVPAETLTEVPAETLTETPMETPAEIPVPTSRFAGFKPTKTFYERLALSSEQMQNRYRLVVDTLLRIENVRVIEGKTQHTYKWKTHCVARLFFKGKTLHVALGLDPKEYENQKYVFVDLSETAKHQNYPTCLKLTSERQTRWSCELIEELAKKKGLPLLEKPVPLVEDDEKGFAGLKGRRKRKSFKRKLTLSPLAKERYNDLKGYLKAVEGIRVIEGRYQITYKYKNVPIVRFAIKGKTLNAYLALDPKEYEDTKYVFTDVSEVKKYANYSMRVKVSSARQVKWVKELIAKIIPQ
ncbi:MAG: hypothetical protein IJF39_00110 [Clostridia bacterium]|nr:hypothetical protein [Clostridia bacterium]